LLGFRLFPFFLQAFFSGPSGGLCGFLEASIRPFVDGCTSRPVGYVEGWFVDADVRRCGIGARLIAAAQQWAAHHGCTEMASDSYLDNSDSLAAHKALGFEESSRVIHLRMSLPESERVGPATSNSGSRMSLRMVDGVFAVCRLTGGAAIPRWATASEFFSITKTADEISIICSQDAVPDGVQCERAWRCLRVAGAMPFTAVGVLASLTAPLAEAGISVFAISTFDTDYLLVKEKDLAAAIEALRGQGYGVSHK
jgi:GNAT superfamily N-acetyltransferase